MLLRFRRCLLLLDEQWNAVRSLGRPAFIWCFCHTTCLQLPVGWLVGEVADYSLSYSFNVEQFAVRHSGKSSMMTRESMGSCCVDRVISGYVR